MSLKQLHKSMIAGRVPLVIAILFLVAMRFFIPGEERNWVLWTNVAVQVGIAFALLYLNQAFIIIKIRTFLPAFFYLLFSLNSLFFPEVWIGNVAAFCLVVCLFFLFASYQDPYSQVKSFNCGIVLAVGSLYYPPLLFLFPLLWIGFYQFQSLNFKSLFASIFGVMLVGLFLFTWCVYKNDIGLFTGFLPDFTGLIQIRLFELSLQEYLFYGYVFLLFIVSGIHIFVSTKSEKIRTRVMLGFLFILGLFLSIGLFLQTDKKQEWAAMLFVPVSFLASHLFSLSNKKITFWFLLFTIVFLVGTFGFGLYEMILK